MVGEQVAESRLQDSTCSGDDDDAEVIISKALLSRAGLLMPSVGIRL